MKIEFSLHALQRMQERGIEKEEISVALKSPDKRSKKGNTQVAMKIRKNGHLLIIIFNSLKDSHKVITVIDTSKVEKYL